MTSPKEAASPSPSPGPDSHDRPWLAPILTAAAGVAAGMLTTLFQPVNDWLSRTVSPEHAEIFLLPDSKNIEQGSKIELHLLVTQESRTPVSPGTIRLVLKGDSIVAENNDLILATPRFEGALRLPEKPIILSAIHPGVEVISADLETENGKNYTSSTQIRVDKRTRESKPIISDFSGRWRVNIGNLFGTMDLVERGRRITGSYELSDKSTGTIDGIRDGEDFIASFLRGSAPSRWFVRAVWKAYGNGQFEIKGPVELQVANRLSPDGWKKTSASAAFFATPES